jgi:hypothetical protein
MKKKKYIRCAAYALEHRQEYIVPAGKQKIKSEEVRVFYLHLGRVRKIKSAPARAKKEGFPPSSGSPATKHELTLDCADIQKQYRDIKILRRLQ